MDPRLVQAWKRTGQTRPSRMYFPFVFLISFLCLAGGRSFFFSFVRQLWGEGVQGHLTMAARAGPG